MSTTSLPRGIRQLIASLFLLAGTLAATAVSTPAHACVICIPFPTQTAADLLDTSETVVLARENPDRPWTYIAVEVLKGESYLAPIDLFVNSSTRRQLKTSPGQGVVLFLDPKDKTQWRSLGFADADYEEMIRAIIQNAPAWHQQGFSNDTRLDFFATYLGHKNRKLHELAYLEIGRASYSQIKQLDTGWSLEQMRSLVDNPRYIEWHALAILMLAIRGDVTDQARILDRFNERERSGLTTNLSAWATALVEIHDEAAVDEIETKYFQNTSRSREELIEVVLALSEHGNYGQAFLRDSIVEAYSTLLVHHPQMAAYVTRDLIAWQRWDLTGQLNAVLNEIQVSDELAAYAIKLYLGQANNATEEGNSPGN